jgi:hypothetical protein
MKKMKRWIWQVIVAGAVCLAGSLVTASDWPDLAPQPELLSPTGEVVNLAGKQTLEFKWSPFIGRMWERQYYDFRLYKGRQTTADNQIIVKQIPKDQYSFTVDAGIFQDGEVYTWGLRQVYMDRKSEQAYSSFKVEKGAESASHV